MEDWIWSSSGLYRLGLDGLFKAASLKLLREHCAAVAGDLNTEQLDILFHVPSKKSWYEMMIL